MDRLRGVFGIGGKSRAVDQSAETGGMPDHDKMTKGGLKTKKAKASLSYGFNCLNPRTEERTSKADGDQGKLEKDWRRHDLLPSDKLHEFSKKQLDGAAGRVRQPCRPA